MPGTTGTRFRLKTKNKMILRPYQSNIIDQTKDQFRQNNRRIIIQLPTGGGKTAIFSAISKMAIDRGNSILIITHRKELLSQSGSTLTKFDLTGQELTAKTKKIEPGILYVGMVETIKSRINKPGYLEFVRSFKIIIIDECHIQNFNKIFESVLPEQFVIGVSATPFRDGKMEPLSKYYDHIIQGVSMKELIDGGYLVNALSYGIPIDLSQVRITAGEFNEKDLGELYDDNFKYVGAVDQYLKHTPGTKFLGFAPTVKNSIELCRQFNAHGIECGHLDALTPDDERREILNDYNEGRLLGIINVGILTTGFDQPDIETIIIYRATKSLPLFLQMCGRGSRPWENKDHFNILDFGNNIGRHGFWQDERVWSLDIKPTKKKSEKIGEFPIKECPNCGALIRSNASVCDHCGYVFPINAKDEKNAKLVLLTPSEINRMAEYASISELEDMRKAKGYKIGWVIHKLKSLKEYEEYAQLKGYKKGWAWYQFSKKSYGKY